MKRILVIGTGPLLAPGVRETGAHALRTWHLVSPLVDAGHDVRLFTLPIPSEDPAAQIRAGERPAGHDGFGYTEFLNCDDGYNITALNRTAREFDPELILGVNSYPCYIASRIRSAAPFWADLNGSVIVEGQARSFVHGNNALLGHYWNTERAALLRADRFSTVSRRQSYLLHGELAAVGRLNQYTFEYNFVSHIPNAGNPMFARPASPPAPADGLRGNKVPRDAFLLLWSGGYNSWTDPDALFEGVERAMSERPDIHYISTGGAVRGHDERTGEKFFARVKASRFSERFHNLGWVDAARLPSLYAECDLGLCIDTPNMETMFGARNRTINMLAAGLAVLTTDGAEISAELVGAGAALGCPGPDAESISRAVVRAADDRATLGERGRKGRDYVLERFSFHKTTKDLLEWAASPRHAPDHAERIRIAATRETDDTKVDPFAIALNPIEEELFACLRAASRPGNRPGKPLGQSLLHRILARIGRLATRLSAHTAHPKGTPAGIDVLTIDPDDRAACDGAAIGNVPVRRLVVSGGRAARNPDARRIIESLAVAAGAGDVTVTDNGLDPDSLHSLCAALIEGRAIRGRLHAEINITGLEPTHVRVTGDAAAWHKANRTLSLMVQLRGVYPGRFDFSVLTLIRPENVSEVGPLHEYITRHYAAEHRVGIEGPAEE